MSEQQNSLSVVTIVPSPNQKLGSAQLVQGTKVMLSDGSELTGVTSVTLTANAGGVWQATITVLPRIIQPVSVEAEFVEVEVTDLNSPGREYAKAAV
ncbi:hypothetical protein [Pseudomonas sp. B21-053]|uniref:hypothetical protein n=1 Tax=Pseudomonas sp. B21-053 TaxID=2895493 RepID=UPI00222EBD8F|nr:hypothetical protein [Pseudomonas sp. B21-053]UZE12775.1 hypothetical protein LOY68_03970 [Pseudomonas sp. B21-053]